MSDPDTDSAAARRASPLAVLSGSLLSLALLVLFIVASGGMLLSAGLVLIGIGLIAAFHYLLWGKSLSDRTAGERVERALNEKARDDDRPGQWTFRR